MDTLGEFLKSFSPGQSGFLFMWILAAIALAAFAMMIERWIQIGLRTNVHAQLFTEKVIGLINDKKFDEAVNLCSSGGRCMLPRVLGGGIKKAITVPELIQSGMEEESLHMVPLLEKRLTAIVTLGNLATLLGLMGTIYGLILAFAAVAQPDVSPTEKSSLLAVGISAAMNTTLLGLIIAVPCVLVYSIFRNRIDEAIAEVDRYSIAVLKVLVPVGIVQKSYKVSGKRITEDIETEPNMVPFMNLMVVLIPLLLSSSEFVKIGMIEIKLPENAQGAGGDSGMAQNAKLDLGIVITDKGFKTFSYFKPEAAGTEVEIPKKDGKYDFEALNRNLADVKQKALLGILRTAKPDLPSDAGLAQLYAAYVKYDLSSIEMFKDHENVKIVAEDKISYETVVRVMDAARGIATPNGNVTMYPNVSIAGGIVQ